MIKKYLILEIILLSLASFGFVFASEYTGNLGTNLNTGMDGVLKSAPAFSPAAGTYHATQSVTLSAADSTAICYTTNEDTPVCNGSNACTTGTEYASAVSIASTTTMKAIACYADGTSGPLSSSQTYTLTCTVSSVSNGSVGAYPGCAITCNSGYTLSGNTCVASGGGGGGGGSYSYTPITTTTTTPITTTTTTPTIPGLNLPYSNPTTTNQIEANRTVLITYLVTLIQQMMTTTTQPSLSGIPAGFQFNNTLIFGSSGIEVKYLQIFLNLDPLTAVGNSGNETTYFGNMTKIAVGKFQIKYGLISGISDQGYGVVGPKTRAKINSLL